MLAVNQASSGGFGVPQREVSMAARLRHIALSVPDPDKAATFFEEAFGMKRVGKAGIGCYVSDGTINVALLKYDGDVPGFHKGYHGLIHFGMWVDNLEESAKQATDAGATYFGGRPDDNPNTFYEVKYKNPDGVIFDLTHNGWRGAVKEVVPAEAEKVAAE
jgi:methylmalonyl-CoA/ethylmalonyl-CoA epimerase